MKVLTASPYLGAVLRSVLAVLAATAVGLHLVGPAAGLWAAAAGAVGGATALQDNPFRRVPAVLWVAVACAVAVVLGALTAGQPWLFAAVLLVWCLGAGLAWAVSPTAGLTATGVTTLLVVTPPVRFDTLDLVAATVAAAASCAVQAALIAAWPPQPWRLQRAALLEAFTALAADAGRLATDPDAQITDTPLKQLRKVFVDNRTRRPSPGYRDGYRLPERIAAGLVAVRRGDAPEAAVTEALRAAGETLAALSGTGRGTMRRVEQTRTRFDAAIAALGDHAAAARLTEAMRGAVAMRFGQLHRRDLRTAASAVMVQLHRRSPILRHTVRLALAVAVGAVGARLIDLPAWLWVPLTALLVLRPETAHTYTRCGGRIAGIAAGVGAAAGLAALWRPTGLLAALIAAVLLALTYWVLRFGYVAMHAMLAATIAVALDIANGTTPVATADAVLSVAFGGGLALLAHVLLPDDEMIRLRQRAGELLKTEIDYAATVVQAYVHELERPADAVAAAWQRTFRARAAFEAASGATRGDSAELRHWLRQFRTALNAVTAACVTLENTLPGQPAGALGREFVAAVDDYIDALRGAPPSPAAPWTVDSAEVTAAYQRVRELAADLPPGPSAARVLVAELGAITRSVSGISVRRAPSAA